MSKRLVWNFEISCDNLLALDRLPLVGRDELRWEARFFWPDDTIITLNGLDKHFLLLSNYQVKHREDCYLLLPNCTYNIKRRRSELLYKPLLEKTTFCGYSKKINLNEYPSDALLPGSDNLLAADLLNKLQTHSQEIEVIKEALVYKLSTAPTIKLELARLELDERIFFSVCIEGHSQLLVTTIANHLLKGQISCDYVNFLQQILAS